MNLRAMLRRAMARSCELVAADASGLEALRALNHEPDRGVCTPSYVGAWIDAAHAEVFEAISIFGNTSDIVPAGITTVASTLTEPGPLKAEIVFESELLAAWRALGLSEAAIAECLREARDAARPRRD